MVETLVLTVGMLVGIILGRLLPLQRKYTVEDYKIERIEKEGFPRLILKLDNGKNSLLSFEFHPAHSRTLSDDLLRESARAMAPKEVMHG